ncbi:rRNA N(6)-adenosine-methyltransferase ZCCHC4 [Aplochiton taeniatus]
MDETNDERFTLEVIPQDGEKEAPSCPHGPTLLFEKASRGDEKGRRFYACSACRDRKDCSFFQWEDDKVSETRLLAREEHIKSKKPPITHQEYCKRLSKFLALPEDQRKFCLDCQALLLPTEHGAHASHKLRGNGLTASQLQLPSRLLRPLENKNSNAQYLFANRSCQFLLDMLVGLGYKKVLCVGTPRLHELIKQRNQESKLQQMKSLLLDIDFRFAQFYGNDEFCHYNMFNHHFFGVEESKGVLQAFLTEEDGGKVVMVADPPFGGLVKPLAHSFSLISQTWREQQSLESGSVEMPMIWAFPYFFEPRILEGFPSFTMLDYQVDYENQPIYKHGKTGRKQTPVRLFTNLAPQDVVLPKEEGYRFCSVCLRYVDSLNKHCAKCNICPSKDGRKWKHCDVCEKCVKPSWRHCSSCARCALPDHPCGQYPDQQGCFSCGSLAHKRRGCPLKHQHKPSNKSKGKKGKHLHQHQPNKAQLKKRKSGAARRAKKRTAPGSST